MTDPVEDDVVLVDAQDRVIGAAPKRAAHALGLLHRAFSIVLVDERGGVLLQRRASVKYHSGGLWANSCCGHPRPGESMEDAASRRAREELGIAVRLREAGVFTYRAAVGDGMIEHEVDHVWVGTAVGELTPDPREIAEIRWVALEELERDLERNPNRYAIWLPEVLRIAQVRDFRY